MQEQQAGPKRGLRGKVLDSDKVEPIFYFTDELQPVTDEQWEALMKGIRPVFPPVDLKGVVFKSTEMGSNIFWGMYKEAQTRE